MCTRSSPYGCIRIDASTKRNERTEQPRRWGFQPLVLLGAFFPPSPLPTTPSLSPAPQGLLSCCLDYVSMSSFPFSWTCIPFIETIWPCERLQTSVPCFQCESSDLLWFVHIAFKRCEACGHPSPLEVTSTRDDGARHAAMEA